MKKKDGRITEGVEDAIERTIETFQAHLNRYWNERDLHWVFYHYLNSPQILQTTQAIDLIRAEFPTHELYEGDRGHYDLVILTPESYYTSAISKLKPQTPWKEFLDFLEIYVAVEIKIWPERKAYKALVEWDIKKLTDPINKIEHAYYLNFVQLDFTRSHMRNYYTELRDYLTERKEQLTKLKILYVPSDSGIQNKSNNWL